MQYTTNFKFKKPELTDAPPDITELNDNWDTVDGKLSDLDANLDGKADKDLGNVTGEDFIATVERTETVEYIFNQNRATDEEAVAGTDNVKYMTPHLVKAAIDSSTPYRVGDLRFLGYPLADKDYLPCDGQLVDGTAYPELYAKIGTNYGGVEPLEDFTVKPLSFTVRDMAYGNGKLVAVGDSNQIAVSLDQGATWTEQTVAGSGTRISYGNNKFMIYDIKNNYFLQGTGDGSWSERTLSNVSGTVKMVYGNNLWVAIVVTGSGDSSYRRLYYSQDDGQTWKETPPYRDRALVDMNDVGYGNGGFMCTFPCAVGGSGVGTSYTIGTGIFDGTSWTFHVVTSFKGDGGWECDLNNIHYLDSRWLCCDTKWGNLMEYTNNRWQKVGSLLASDLAKSNELFLAVGYGGVYTSFDGNAWRKRANTSGARNCQYLGQGAWALLMNDWTIALTKENLCQFYLPDHNKTIKYCYIKATEGGRTYYQAPTESGEAHA